MIRVADKVGHDDCDVLLVNSYPITCRGIMLTLESMGLSVKWVVSTGDEAESICHKHQPDLVVVDVNLIDISGFEFVRRRRAYGDTAGFLILADHHSEPLAVKTISCGANAFVLQNCELKELEMAIASAINNEKFICSRHTIALSKP